jgi:Flp pilus assembly protein TadD
LGWAGQPEAIPRRAVQAHRESLKVDANSVMAHSNVGAALAREGEYGDAIREFHEAPRLTPENPNVPLNLALAYDKPGEIDKAASARLLTGANQLAARDPAGAGGTVGPL